MTLDDLIQSLTPEMYQNLRTAVELGRFPDGRRLDKEQVEMCLQAIIYYEKVNDLPADRVLATWKTAVNRLHTIMMTTMTFRH